MAFPRVFPPVALRQHQQVQRMWPAAWAALVGEVVAHREPLLRSRQLLKPLNQQLPPARNTAFKHFMNLIVGRRMPRRLIFRGGSCATTFMTNGWAIAIGMPFD